jgi:hypothetical protein
MDNNFSNAVLLIKDAIIRSRYQATTLVNKELLGLYYAVGKYVSTNSRDGYWGKGAIKQISNDLQKELPGLRGFGETSIRNMRTFYESWQMVFVNHQSSTDDLNKFDYHANHPLVTDDLNESNESLNRPLIMDDLESSRKHSEVIDLSLLSKHISSFDSPEFFITNFYKVGFTHHTEILAKEKSLDGRFFYVAQCAAAFWTVEALKSHVKGELKWIS